MFQQESELPPLMTAQGNNLFQSLIAIIVSFFVQKLLKNMSQHKLAPKYILLTAPTLKHSQSTHVNGFDAKNSEADYRPQQVKWQKADAEKKESKKAGSKQLDSVRKQLASSMQDSISQAKRHSVLKQLNSMLERSNLELQERSKDQWKQRVQEDKKKLEKEEYEIEQILQKYNEEVARINTLREMANSARTDRVVYSALFKKIQWEIKHYQNMYREIIVRTQANKIAKSRKLASIPQNLQSVDEFQAKEQIVKNIQKHEQPAKKALFMTELSKRCESKYSKKGSTRRVHQAQHNLSELIEQIDSKIGLIVKTVECQNFEHALEWYSSLAKENGKLLDMINQEQLKIQEVQNQILRINAERRNSEIIQEGHLMRLQRLPTTRKLKTNPKIKDSIDRQEGSTSDLVIQLAKVAGISVTEGRLLTDVVVELQERLSRQQLVNSELRSGSILQSGVESMLSKMDRFDSCERIFSKRQFQGQYMRQLKKQKKPQRARKLIKESPTI